MDRRYFTYEVRNTETNELLDSGEYETYIDDKIPEDTNILYTSWSTLTIFNEDKTIKSTQVRKQIPQELPKYNLPSNYGGGHTISWKRIEQFLKDEAGWSDMTVDETSPNPIKLKWKKKSLPDYVYTQMDPVRQQQEKIQRQWVETENKIFQDFFAYEDIPDEHKTPEYFSLQKWGRNDCYFYKDELIVTIHPFEIKPLEDRNGMEAVRNYELNYLKEK